MPAPIKLYRTPKSGHCHRVELMMALLDLPYETVDLDMMNGAHKAPDYLTLSPLGQVPAIDDNGATLSDSNAILTYLVHQYGEAARWTGETALERATVQRWLSIAAGEIASGPATARLVTVFGAPLDHEAAKTKAHALLKVMNATLAQQKYLAGDSLTIADVAAYSYIAHAPEGGVRLEPYAAVLAWLARIEAEPKFIGMAQSPVPATA
ncbi:glutathione S-transferase [Tateyamaria omphalii]|uniref:glutathione S-transferase family protein n=1 Tax=Tateyamaria omphalii TaxID=299262 RepID=UPI001C999F9B|nr:glutathione S-transferase [Tateyamaria omphalii]MBY5934718.1 glutathione S-transferase [Tateyamaria omphalii]